MKFKVYFLEVLIRIIHHLRSYRQNVFLTVRINIFFHQIFLFTFIFYNIQSIPSIRKSKSYPVIFHLSLGRLILVLFFPPVVLNHFFSQQYFLVIFFPTNFFNPKISNIFLFISTTIIILNIITKKHPNLDFIKLFKDFSH